MTSRVYLPFRQSVVVALALLICLGLATAASAQNQAGSISGTLMDPAGSVLRGAQISIPAKGVIVSTDEQGRFFFSGLQAGDYTISVSYIGFQKADENRHRQSGRIGYGEPATPGRVTKAERAGDGRKRVG